MLMRTQHLITLFLLGLLTLTGCNTSIVEKRATGLPYEVLVVMTKEVNDSEVGELVRAQLNTPGLRDFPRSNLPCVLLTLRSKPSTVC